MGATCNGISKKRGGVVCSGNARPHKCLRIFSHKTSSTNILENLEAQSHSFPEGQQTYLLILGGTQNSN